jgi:uncharacterized protein
MKRWLSESRRKLFTIEDSPESVARGLALGILIGFTPLFGLKTLLTLLLAVLLRGNKIAAVIGVAVHDLVLPFLPLLLHAEYEVGYWLLSRPHHWPQHFHHTHLRPHEWLSWTTFLHVGAPLLLGSLVLAAPVSLFGYVMTRYALSRKQPREPAG